MKAFPKAHVQQQGGMDLRDYFAAKALDGMLSTKDWFGNSGVWRDREVMLSAYASEAYHFADAMIKARGQYDKT